jgi:hypothetical protein
MLLYVVVQLSIFIGYATWYTTHVSSTVLTTVLYDPLVL